MAAYVTGNTTSLKAEELHHSAGRHPPTNFRRQPLVRARRIRRPSAWQTPAMPDREPEQDQPSLELPSLGGWRRRRRGKRVAEQPVEPPPPVPTPEPEPALGGGDQTTAVLPVVAESPFEPEVDEE